MVLLLFDFIEAEREANWDIHLECFKQMLPYDRAFDQAKYFKWGLIYVIDMLRSRKKHPTFTQILKKVIILHLEVKQFQTSVVYLQTWLLSRASTETRKWKVG